MPAEREVSRLDLRPSWPIKTRLYEERGPGGTVETEILRVFDAEDARACRRCPLWYHRQHAMEVGGVVMCRVKVAAFVTADSARDLRIADDGAGGVEILRRGEDHFSRS